MSRVCAWDVIQLDGIDFAAHPSLRDQAHFVTDEMLACSMSMLERIAARNGTLDPGQLDPIDAEGALAGASILYSRGYDHYRTASFCDGIGPCEGTA